MMHSEERRKIARRIWHEVNKSLAKLQVTAVIVKLVQMRLGWEICPWWLIFTPTYVMLLPFVILGLCVITFDVTQPYREK